MQKRYKRLAAFLFLLFLILGTWHILSGKSFRTSEGRVFGTTYHICYQSSQDLDADIRRAMKEVDEALSMFNDSSTLSPVSTVEKVSEKMPVLRKSSAMVLRSAEKHKVPLT